MNNQQREAMQHYEAALKAAFPDGATGEVFNHWNEAKKALAQPQGEWVDLTDEEIYKCRSDYGEYETCRSVINKFKSKNTPPVVPQGEPVACGCGATAYCLIRHTNLPEHNFTPICLSCLQEHEQNAQEVNEHEMHNFGGAYGLVTWETKPLYAAPVRTKNLTDDEKFLLIEAYETQKYKWTAMDFIDAVIAADREKNK